MFCHVAGGALWTSIDLFVRTGSRTDHRLDVATGTRPEFTAKFKPKMVIIMPTVVTMTLATGLQIRVPSRHPLAEQHGPQTG
jgi:hypothetical protein